MPSVLQQTQVEVEQLRREAAMKRTPVSQAVEDIKVGSNIKWPVRPRLGGIQGYSYDQRLEYVDIDFNVLHTPIVRLGQ